MLIYLHFERSCSQRSNNWLQSVLVSVKITFLNLIMIRSYVCTNEKVSLVKYFFAYEYQQFSIILEWLLRYKSVNTNFHEILIAIGDLLYDRRLARIALNFQIFFVFLIHDSNCDKFLNFLFDRNVSMF